MAFGQIDPARLEGDALRRWYLRSPAEIEEERGRLQAQAYDAFFSARHGGPAPESNTLHEARLEILPSPSSRSPRFDASRRREDPNSDQPQARAERHQLAAASPRGFWDYWGVGGCRSCHGYRQETVLKIQPGNVAGAQDQLATRAWSAKFRPEPPATSSIIKLLAAPQSV